MLPFLSAGVWRRALPVSAEDGDSLAKPPGQRQRHSPGLHHTGKALRGLPSGAVLALGA